MAAIIPQWAKTLGEMIDNETMVQTRCTKCEGFRRFTTQCLIDLASAVGPDYSLVNRRCRCRLTEGCPGWNRFWYLHGVMRPLWEDSADLRWWGP